MINLMSDTVTKPTPAMLDAMMHAKVGDDVFGEDETVNTLEEKIASMFGHEAALFCPSGTMTNQIAIKCNTEPLDEILCDKTAHIYWSEVGGYAFHSQVAAKLLDGQHGIISAQQVVSNINPSYDWTPQTSLLCIENTGNKAGGNFYTYDEMKSLHDVCKQHQLKYHMDGARFFNASIEANYDVKKTGELFDSISICFSKGLGAPIGSALIGNASFIKKARKIRKVMGGGMRQAGYLAAACIYALDHHLVRLKDDHILAKQLEETLKLCMYVKEIYPVKTNIVIAKLIDELPVEKLIQYLESHQIKTVAFGNNTIRFVTHLDINESMISQTCDRLKAFHI